jgi:hypothetical protein
LRAADAGFDRHFVKPVSVYDIVQVLDQAILTRATSADASVTQDSVA